ncbi:MAG: hypothetical protein H0T46_05885 [Deltaproteobacteria bacterium]|nr:hypothetical protein [Deltaproteobacteria bacterium]
MPRKLRTRVLGIAIVSACGFTATNIEREDGALSPIDSSVDAYIPDASLCVAASKQCIGANQKLRVCDSSGASSRDIDCAWSCLETPEPHCAQLVPSGGAVTTADLESTALTDHTIMSATINTDDGSITGLRAAGGGIINGIDYTQRGSVGVFRFNKLTINGLVNIRGTRAAAIVSIGEITINGGIDAQGDCSGSNAGPGGSPGGAAGKDGSGSGSGGAGSGSNPCSGGGGAGHGGAGGDGGGRDNDGDAFGTPSIAQLFGGAGGGGGGGEADGGEGGGGGGALQLVANKRIKINGAQPLAGRIHAGGCGGRGGLCGGGGGGAGGTILIEAPVIELASSALAVNGGGGGGGGGGGNTTGTSGERATLSTTKASGGNGANGVNGGGPPEPDGGDGGDGGDDNAASGSNGENAKRAGGGGGAVGRMRFNTLSGSIVTSGTVVLSPALSTMTTQTTTSRGMAAIK